MDKIFIPDNFTKTEIALEEWVNVPTFKNCQASTLGRISYIKGDKRVLRKARPNKKGYLRLKVVKQDGTRANFKVATLIAMAFLNFKPCGHKLVVDHKFKNINDNRPESLQIITSRENLSKDKKRKPRTSRFTGVSLNKALGKWKAQINIKGKIKHLGYHLIEEEAAEAYTNELIKINTKHG